MSRNYKFWDQDKAYFITYATVYWVDVLTRQVYRDIVLESLKYCINNKGLIVYSWCIMSNHVHLIIGTKREKMQDIVRDMKKFTSKEIIQAIEGNSQESRKKWMLALFARAGRKNSNNKKYQFWQQHNQPIELDYAEIIQQKLDYIHNNPVKAGLVNKPWQYIYSSASAYAGKEGLLAITKID